MKTILYIHGTGVRLPSYQPDFEHVQRMAQSAGVHATFVPCAWGDPLGVVFEGKSVPGHGGVSNSEEERRDLARWTWLLDDPLFELQQWTIHDASQPHVFLPPGTLTDGEKAWNAISQYQPSAELRLLLQRGNSVAEWDQAWKSVVVDSLVAKDAFNASSHEIAEVSESLARALVAQLHVVANHSGKPGPTGDLRRKLVQQLLQDWGQYTLGIGIFIADIFKRLGTWWVRKNREVLSNGYSLQIGDVLLYQSRGAEVRDFIRKKIELHDPPVTLVAHSLGGIACVDLLAMPGAPKVANLVTAGSQSPFLYELGALASLQPDQPLPDGFPRWLNFWDPNDFLSFIANPFWPQVIDHEIRSELPFPDSHSAYFGNEHVWTRIRDFIQ